MVRKIFAIIILAIFAYLVAFIVFDPVEAFSINLYNKTLAPAAGGFIETARIVVMNTGHSWLIMFVTGGLIAAVGAYFWHSSYDRVRGYFVKSAEKVSGREYVSVQPSIPSTPVGATTRPATSPPAETVPAAQVQEKKEGESSA